MNDRVPVEMNVLFLGYDHLGEVVIIEKRLALRFIFVHELELLADHQPHEVNVAIFNCMREIFQAQTAYLRLPIVLLLML